MSEGLFREASFLTVRNCSEAAWSASGLPRTSVAAFDLSSARAAESSGLVFSFPLPALLVRSLLERESPASVDSS